MIDRIQVYRQNHVRIETAAGVVHIDPFQTDTAPKDADFVLITHDHYDHFSKEEIGRVAKPGAVLIVPETMKGKAAAAAGLVGKTVFVKPGETYRTDGLSFETVPAYNIGKPFHPRGAGWVGYVLETDEGRIYIAGDTDCTEEATAVRCDVAVVPIGGTYTMNAKQAAKLVSAIRPKFAVPVHYGAVVGKPEDGNAFRNAMEPGIEVVFKIQF